MWMRATTALAIVTSFAFAVPDHNAAIAADEEEFDFATVEALDDTTLDAQRGGFVVSGMTIALGAEMRTFLDDELAMTTTVSWRDGTAETNRWVSAELTPATAEQLQAGFLSSGGITMRVGDQAVYLANGGETALVQRTDGGLQNILLNTASNTSIRQEMDVTLDISGYQSFGADISRSSLLNNLGATLDSASLAASRP